MHSSPGSYNNEAGVPLTLLDAPATAEAVVLEMGARARGDIAALCAIARPTVGVITNVGLAHAGPLGGPIGVALTKGELFEALPAHGLGVLDADDPATEGIAARTHAPVVRVQRARRPAPTSTRPTSPSTPNCVPSSRSPRRGDLVVCGSPCTVTTRW